MYLEYLDLPKLSEDLIKDVYNTINTSDKYTSQGNTDAENYEHFSSIDASKKLKQFTESILILIISHTYLFYQTICLLMLITLMLEVKPTIMLSSRAAAALTYILKTR